MNNKQLTIEPKGKRLENFWKELGPAIQRLAEKENSKKAVS
jgi:hypothetical protein